MVLFLYLPPPLLFSNCWYIYIYRYIILLLVYVGHERLLVKGVRLNYSCLARDLFFWLSNLQFDVMGQLQYFSLTCGIGNQNNHVVVAVMCCASCHGICSTVHRFSRAPCDDAVGLLTATSSSQSWMQSVCTWPFQSDREKKCRLELKAKNLKKGNGDDNEGERGNDKL